MSRAKYTVRENGGIEMCIIIIIIITNFSFRSIMKSFRSSIAYLLKFSDYY